MAYFPYHSGSHADQAAGPERRPVLEAVTALAAPVDRTFRVFFHTSLYRPNHRVTVRNLTDGWMRDIYGIYRDGAWVFAFENGRYPHGLEMKFVLDGQIWMDGFNMVLPASQDHHFDESLVSFPGARPRYRHGYDNLRTEESALQQERLRSNLRGDIDYDVIVIGSGVGGGILADALSDRGVNTLVLEAGGFLYPSHITNLPGDWPALPARHQAGHFENEPGSDFLFGVQMGLGGRSVFWSGLIPRMRRWEMALWPAPVAGHLANGGYDAAETVLRKRRTLGPFQDETIGKLRQRFPDHVVEDLPRSRHQPNLDGANDLGNVLEKSTGVFSTADLLLDSMAYTGLAGRDNLTINLNHLVTHVETDGNRATAVVCQDLIGNVERRYQGKFVVLAAGSLESARIAQRSALDDPAGKIGRGLTDHPAYFSREYRLPAGSEFGGRHDHAKILMAHRAATASAHAFNAEVLINPKFWDARHPDDDVRKQRIDSLQESSVRLQFIFASQLDDDNYIIDNGVWQKARVKVNRNQSGVGYFDEVRELRNRIVEVLQVPPFDRGEGMHYGNEGTVHHAGGTLRMSGDRSGVVDTDLRFDSYDNLYAADVSVFPMIPVANPVLTVSALCLRLADHLRARI